MNNDTEEFIEVENEATKEFDDEVGDKPVPSEGFLDTPSDATTTEATSGSSIEDVPSSKQCKKFSIILISGICVVACVCVVVVAAVTMLFVF